MGYTGEWKIEKVDNPAYKGEWNPKQLDNPDYVEEVYPFDDIGAVGFELWTVNKGSIFDNILLTDSYEHAKAVAEKVWKPFVEKEKDAKKEYDKKMGKDTPAAPADEEEDDDDDGADDEPDS